MEAEAVYIKKSFTSMILMIMASVIISAGFLFFIRIIHFPLVLTVIVSVVILLLNIGCWRWVLNTEPAMTINREGIFHKKQMLYWNNIKSYKTIYLNAFKRPDEEIVWITFKDDKRVCINLVWLRTNLSEIRTHITMYAANYKIKDEGHVII